MTPKIVSTQSELKTACDDLGILDIKYLPSPKQVKSSDRVNELASHATSMLLNYKRYLSGDKNSGIVELQLD